MMILTTLLLVKFMNVKSTMIQTFEQKNQHKSAELVGYTKVQKATMM